MTTRTTLPWQSSVLIWRRHSTELITASYSTNCIDTVFQLTSSNEFKTIWLIVPFEWKFRTTFQQGSVLGPALFCVMEGDFSCSDTNSSPTKNADNITIVTGLRTSIPSEIEETIHGVNRIYKQIHNRKKSQLLLISRKQINFQRPLSIKIKETMKILGVVLNNHLTWYDHVDEISKKASKRLFITRVLKQLVSAEELHQIHVAAVRAIFDYECALLVGLDGDSHGDYNGWLQGPPHHILWQTYLWRWQDALRKRCEALLQSLFHKIEVQGSH